MRQVTSRNMDRVPCRSERKRPRRALCALALVLALGAGVLGACSRGEDAPQPAPQDEGN